MSAIVQVSSVSKQFLAPDGRRVEALKAVSLQIPAGRFTTLLGPSGCGKTTLLRLIGGFDDPDSGGVLIDGELMTGRPPNQRPTNTVFQHYALFPHMTVAGNIAYGLEVAGVARPEIARRIDEALEMVRLPGFGARRIAQLSGGQQQRVALARALVLRPKILLLDEPMAALDRKLRKEMQAELKRLQHDLGLAFLCVTHDQEEALSMSDLVVVMNQGRIEQAGTPFEIYNRPRTAFVAGFVGDISLFHGQIELGGCFRSAGGTRLVLPAPAGSARAGLATGTALICAIRPEKLRLAEPGSAEPVIIGRVRDVTYLGASSRIDLDLPGGEGLTATVGGAVTSPPGTELALRYDPADLCLLEGAR